MTSKTHAELLEERSQLHESKQRISEMEKCLEKKSEALRASEHRAAEAERMGMDISKKLQVQLRERDDLAKIWGKVETKLMGRIKNLQADTKGLRAKLAWESDQSRAMEAESKRKIDDSRNKLKMSQTIANDLKNQVAQLQRSQKKLQQNATETIESLQNELNQLTRRNQEEVGVLQREKQSLIATQNHLRFELEHTRSKMQEAQGLAAQRALATKKAKKQASEARDLAMRQQQQNRRALDAFDRAQGTTKEKDARVALWKQQLSGTEERAQSLESELEVLRGDYLRVSADLKSARKTIEEMRRGSTVAEKEKQKNEHDTKSSSSEFNELKGRWDRLLQDEDEKFSDPDRSLFSKSSIRSVDEYLDEKKASHAMTFARKAAEMDENDEKHTRSNSFHRFPGISSSSSSRPVSSRRRHSGSSVESSSRGGDEKATRPRSSSNNRRRGSKSSLLPRVVRKGGAERAYDSLISTPPVSAASTSSRAYDALIRTPGSEFDTTATNLSRGGDSAETSRGAFQSLEELEYVS